MSRLRAVASAELLGQAVPQPARGVGAAAHLVEQVLPRPGRDATVLQIGARELAAPVEVLHVLGFQRLDLGLDEGVHLGQHARKVVRQGEIHGDSFLEVRFDQYPYSVFFQIVDSVRTAFSSVVTTPKAEVSDRR